VDSLKVLDPEWPIREADIAPCLFRADFVAEIGMQTARDGWCHF
jgi:hypothetical protein